MIKTLSSVINQCDVLTADTVPMPSPHFDVELALGHSGVGVNFEKAASQAFWHPPQIPPGHSRIGVPPITHGLHTCQMA